MCTKRGKTEHYIPLYCYDFEYSCQFYSNWTPNIMDSIIPGIPSKDILIFRNTIQHVPVSFHCDSERILGANMVKRQDGW